MNIDNHIFKNLQELSDVMRSLGSRPPVAILSEMIDRGDSDRNGKVNFILIKFTVFNIDNIE